MKKIIVLVSLVFAVFISSAQCVTTLAGSGISGFADGTGNTVKFKNPYGVAVDGSGNVYVADADNYRIRKITSASDVSTFAGSGTQSYTDGIGISAGFILPLGLAIDGSGNIYVGDYWKIRKITPAGAVTTLAGSGTYGYADGIGTIAQFKDIYGIAVDGIGNVYVADCYNNRIRKVSPTGVVTTLAGSGTAGYADGTATTAQFQCPRGVAVDGIGNVYVADCYNNRIRKVSPTGVVTTLAGSGTQGSADGTATTAQFIFPTGVAIDAAGNAYVTDNNRIRKITSGGNVTTLAGTLSAGYSDGGASSAQFQSTWGVAVDGTGNVYVADQNNQRIRKISFALSTAAISYSASSFCKTLVNSQPVTLTGTGLYGGGVYSSTTGLFINSSTGAVTPSTSTPGTYTVTYSKPSSGGCSAVAGTTQVTITALPTATISYSGSPFCNSLTSVQAIRSGTGAFTGGTYSSTAGLSINAATGVINPSLSTAGTYTVTYTIPASGGCAAVATTTSVVILPAPTASISADGTVSTSTTITNGSSVQLQINGTLNAQPNIQWTPATGISSATVANPVVYPSATTTYTASFANNNGCTQTTSFTVNVTPQPNIGNLSLSSSTATVGLFDTITVDVQLTSATNLYSLYMKLKGNAAVSQYLDYSGHTAGTLLGTNVISTPPTVTNGVPDFGMTKVGAVPGYSGSGLFYSFRFVPKNNVVIPAGTTFCFYLDDVSSYNASGIPCGLTNQGQYCYTFTNQVAVWPGDLNKSNTVTTADILPIGYFYNSTGAARANATIQWNAQPATLWGYNRTSTNSDAYKVFADSNGDGVINNADQAAIGFNMNQVHNRPSSAPTAWVASSDFSVQQLPAAVGSLTVTPNSTIINGAALPQTVTFTVSVNNTGGLNALYGISVNLLFDQTVFDLSTATIDYTGSIFGNAGSDCLVMNFASATAVSVGLTRFNNAAINGQGLLFKVTLQTKTTLPNLTQTPVTAYVDAANNQAGDTLVIQDAPATNFTIINNLGLNTIKQDEFVLYPNPASEVIYLQMGANTQLAGMKVKVVNLLGQVIEEQPILNNTTELSTKNWGAAGVYFVQIINQNNTTSVTKKVIVERK